MKNRLARSLYSLNGMYKSSLIAVFLLFITAVSCTQHSAGQEVYYPGDSWEQVQDLEAAGWSKTKLDEAEEFAGTLNTAAVVIVHKGRIVRKWGETERKFMCHSIRKSFLSAMYGIYVQKGAINLSTTLEELGIDDNEPSLTEEEKQATIRMLLEARSGIYHPALYETAAMAAARPKRHSHAPGTFWYYNNWDFNASGTIFEQLTGTKIHPEFKKLIADPIGMKNFNPETDGKYVSGDDSEHEAYPFTMNAMDMARFGLLMERNGKWKDEQIIPEFWIKESTVSYSDAGTAGGYGYMWWVAVDGKHFDGISNAPYGLFTARGAGGHVIAVVPDLDLVVINRVDTYKRGNRMPYSDFGKLFMKILDARQSSKPAM